MNLSISNVVIFPNRSVPWNTTCVQSARYFWRSINTAFVCTAYTYVQHIHTYNIYVYVYVQNILYVRDFFFYHCVSGNKIH